MAVGQLGICRRCLGHCNTVHCCFFEPTLVHSEVNSNGWLIARAFVMVFSKGGSWWSQGANGRLPIQLPIPEDNLLDCVCEKAGAVEAW